jgi:hypothetical protein
VLIVSSSIVCVCGEQFFGIGTRGSSISEANFSHASIEPATFVEAVVHKEW